MRPGGPCSASSAMCRPLPIPPGTRHKVLMDGSVTGDSKGGGVANGCCAAAGGVASGVRAGGGVATSGGDTGGGRAVEGRAGRASTGRASRGSVVCGHGGHGPPPCEGSRATETQGQHTAGREIARQRHPSRRKLRPHQLQRRRQRQWQTVHRWQCSRWMARRRHTLCI